MNSFCDQRHMARWCRKPSGMWHGTVQFVVVTSLLVMAQFCYSATCGSIPTNGSAGLPISSGTGGGQWGVDSATVINNGSTSSTVSPSGNTAVNASGAGLPLPTLPPFLPATFPTVGTADLSTSGTIAAGEYRTVSATGSPAVFSGGTYYIETLNANNGVRLAPGDYFIKTFNLGGNLTISPVGEVRIFISGAGSFNANSNGLTVNNGGSVANFQVYLYDGGKFSATKNDFGFTGLIYAPGSATEIKISGPYATITGAVLGGGKVELGKSGAGNFATVNYTPSTRDAFAAINTCGLVADWRMDETAWAGAAGEVKDNTSNALNGTVISSGTAANTVTGKLCKGGDLASDYISIPSSTSNSKFNLSNGATFMFWVNARSNSAVPFYSFGTDHYAYLTFLSGKVANSTSPGGWLSPLITGSASVPTNAWRHVAIQFDPVKDTQSIYINGALDNSVSWASSIPYLSSNTFQIGRAAVSIGTYYYNGIIDEFKIFKTALSAADISAMYGNENSGLNFDGTARSCPSTGPDHVEFSHDAGGLTCQAETITAYLCTTSASCANDSTTQLGTGSVTVNLPSPGTNGQWFNSAGTTALAAVNTAASLSVSNGTQFRLRKTTAATVNMASTVSSGATNLTVQCQNGTTACDLPFSATGFLVSAPNHFACDAQTVTIKSVKSNDTATACIPGFQNLNRSIQLYSSYVTPTTGSQASFDYWTSASGASKTTVATLSTSAASPTTLTNLYWDASGAATLSNFKYQNVGKVRLNPVYTGSTGTNDAGLSMALASGGDFIAAPKSFVFSGTTAGPVGAGKPFATTITAMNNCTTPAVASNFGSEGESVTLTAGSRVAPTGTNDCTNGPCTGALTGSSSLTWTGGAATDAAVRYGEVGQITLKADLASASYLGSGLTATGTSGTVGSFVPAYFDTTVTPGCGSFTYSKQPFTVKAVAKNALGATTVNFSAGLMTGASACSVCSTAVTLGDPTGTTNFNGTNTIPATAFLKGEATSTTVAYTLPTTTTAPSTITLRGSASGVSATGVNEGTTQVRSGRVRVGNAFGSALLPLSLSLQSEYFKNVTEQWVPNSADNCSKTIPVPTVANNGLVFGTPTARNQLSSGEVVADIGGVTSGSVALPFSSGIAAIKLRSPTSATLGPGLSNFGFVDMDFGASGFGWLTWLPSATSNAKGRAEFGLYKGSNRYIFKQEVR